MADDGDGPGVMGEIDPLRRRRRPSLSKEASPPVVGWRSKSGSGAGCRSSVAAAPKRFAVLRVAKIKTLGNLRSSAKHTFRERETPNADPGLRGDNEVWIGAEDAEGMAQAWAERAPEKIRKNAVLALEYLVTASPGALGAMSREEQDAFFARGLEWLCDRHGEENVLSAVIHRDETTPHMTAMVIPLDDSGHLNARSFTGGRELLAAMQTDFAEAVADWGIERGVHHSRARHVSIREYYARVNDRPAAELDLPEPERGGFLGRGRETPEAYAERLREAAGDRYAHQAVHYETRLREASEALSEAERAAAAQRLDQAANGVALEALRAWSKVGRMEDDDARRELEKNFADDWDRTAMVFDRMVPGFVEDMDAWLREAGVETEPAMARRLERERSLGRKGPSREDDDGWEL